MKCVCPKSFLLGKLLDVLDKNLELLLPLHPELTGERDPLPFYPSTVSLVDLNDFYGMMECEIFSNYVNLFLNLPLFSRLASLVLRHCQY